MDDKLVCLTLSAISTYGPKRINTLLKKIDVSSIQSPADFIQPIQDSGLKIRIPSVEELESSFDSAAAVYGSLKNMGIRMTTILSHNYPHRLRDGVDNPPIVLFYKGDLAKVNEKAVAIVGTRDPTPKSLEIAGSLTDEMASRGYCIVSGLAKGIDTMAHKKAIENRAVTVAVLAHGLNTIYPKENTDLAASILENDGVLLSEYPPDEKIAPYQFVSRDRIQSALSRTVFVVQTTMDGGTMKTAGFAIKQDRELYVYSGGDSDPKFAGNQQLISEGSKTFGNDVSGIVLQSLKKQKVKKEDENPTDGQIKFEVN